MTLILKGNAMHPLASKFIVGNPISPKQVYNVFMGGWGGVTRGGYRIFSIGGGYRIFSLGGGYQGWVRDFTIGGEGGGVTRGGYGIFPLGGGGLRNHQVQRTTITTCVFISTIADFRSGRNCNTPK